MQRRGSRPEPEPFAPTEDENFRSELSEAGSPILDSVARGKDAISAVTAEAVNSAQSDLTALPADLNGLKDTVTKFISQVSSEAAKSAREVTSSVADQVGGVATDYAGKGAEMTSAASEHGKTIATEFESMARRNPAKGSRAVMFFFSLPEVRHLIKAVPYKIHTVLTDSSPSAKARKLTGQSLLIVCVTLSASSTG